MDPRLNPYTPNAGARPPVLAGRADLLTAFDVLLARLLRGRTEQSMIVTGLQRRRQDGPALGELRGVAEVQGWTAVEAEITKQMEFGPRIAQLARRALLGIAPKARWKDRARRAAGILKSFTLTVSTDGALSAALDIEPVEGVADSGDLANDLTDLFVALGEAARDQGTGVVFLFDEIQFLTRPQFEALIAALHKTVQRALPVTLVGAGLPQIPRLAGEAKSYAERLFTVPRSAGSPMTDAVEALTAPAPRAWRGLQPRRRPPRSSPTRRATRTSPGVRQDRVGRGGGGPISLKTVRAVGRSWKPSSTAASSGCA